MEAAEALARARAISDNPAEIDAITQEILIAYEIGVGHGLDKAKDIVVAKLEPAD